MRHFTVYIFGLILLTISCRQTENKTSTATQTDNTTTQTDSSQKQIAHFDKTEDFDEFLENFSGIPDFQLDRVKFPLPDCDYPGDKDSHCDTLVKSKWIHLILIDTSKSPIMITKLYDNFKLEMKNTGERVLSFEANGTSVCSLYFFRLIDGKWYLVKRLVCGDE